MFRGFQPSFQICLWAQKSLSSSLVSRFIWIFTALSGASSVIFGAVLAHVLKGSLDLNDLERIETAVFYQFTHTLVILTLAIKLKNKISNEINWSIYLFIAGVILFSGSLIIYTFTKIGFLVFITPIGGMLLILGWLNLVRYRP
jgi:uncharacterized membrane protein YgdD (TMEM256/DUF423 family)